MSKKDHKLEHNVTITFDSNAHRYIKDQQYVVGMSSILKYLSAPALEGWKLATRTNKIKQQMQNENIPPDVIEKIIINAKAEEQKSSDTTLSIGSIVHELIELWLKGEKVVLPKNPVHLECFRKFQTFWKKNKLKPVDLEKILYSKRGFAGTLDIVAKDPKGRIWLIDVKTSSGFFISMVYQLHGYKLAYEEQTGKKIDKMFIVRLPKNDEDFEAREFTFQKTHEKAFLGLLNCHKSQLLYNEQSRNFKIKKERKNGKS